ncbi:hypothetical protein [Nocardia brasiliensis]|uniref:hypothetical protein n=1 Tax=Nocardia brasiliensis TaxID=37326 RepID=UPI0024551B9E|nr:hypothetical protein [Nocardia brasiliensis]
MSFIMADEPKVIRSAFTRHDEPGTAVSGLVLAQQLTNQLDPKTKKPKTARNGRPLQQLEVTILTSLQVDPDDDGRRLLFVKGNMQKAIKAAVLASGDSDFRNGARLCLTFTGLGAAFSADYSPPKQFAARYEPPTDASLAELAAFMEELAS